MKSFPLAHALAIVLALAAVPLGCGGRAETPDARPHLLNAAFPLRVSSGGAELELAGPPSRVLPANAAWVDFVSLLIGPERVAALPAEAFGYSRLSESPGAWRELPSLPAFEGERVLALAPDLVLVHGWQNPETVATLRRAGLAVLVSPVPESWSEIVDTVTLLGAVLGVPAEARRVTDALAARCQALSVRARPFARLSVSSYTNLGAGGWTSGARTTGAILLGLAGLSNATAEAGLVGDVPADAERLLALSPDVFLVGRPDRSEQSPPSAEFLLTERSLATLPAVRERRIVALAPALFTSASPELLRGAEVLVDELERLERAGALPHR